jgi:hypothetical protein
MLPTKFRIIWPSGFRGEDFFKSANQKQELAMVASVNEHGYHRKFLFLIGRFLNNLLFFLKTDWKVRDTGSGATSGAGNVYLRFLAHLAKGNVSFGQVVSEEKIF